MPEYGSSYFYNGQCGKSCEENFGCVSMHTDGSKVQETENRPLMDVNGSSLHHECEIQNSPAPQSHGNKMSLGR